MQKIVSCVDKIAGYQIIHWQGWLPLVIPLQTGMSSCLPRRDTSMGMPAKISPPRLGPVYRRERL
ncbi:MAG: hypothetical protein ACO1N5_07955, partial [Noviherbaspirillum sp.]